MHKVALHTSHDFQIHVCAVAVETQVLCVMCLHVCVRSVCTRKVCLRSSCMHTLDGWCACVRSVHRMNDRSACGHHDWLHSVHIMCVCALRMCIPAHLVSIMWLVRCARHPWSHSVYITNGWCVVCTPCICALCACMHFAQWVSIVCTCAWLCTPRMVCAHWVMFKWFTLCLCIRAADLCSKGHEAESFIHHITWQ